MYVKQLAEIIASMAKDINCDGGIRTGSHVIPSSVSFYVEGNEDSEYELIDIETDRLTCGCAVGITFKIKKI